MVLFAWQGLVCKIEPRFPDGVKWRGKVAQVWLQPRVPRSCVLTEVPCAARPGRGEKIVLSVATMSLQATLCQDDLVGSLLTP